MSVVAPDRCAPQSHRPTHRTARCSYERIPAASAGILPDRGSSQRCKAQPGSANVRFPECSITDLAFHRRVVGSNLQETSRLPIGTPPPGARGSGLLWRYWLLPARADAGVDGPRASKPELTNLDRRRLRLSQVAKKPCTTLSSWRARPRILTALQRCAINGRALRRRSSASTQRMSPGLSLGQCKECSMNSPRPVRLTPAKQKRGHHADRDMPHVMNSYCFCEPIVDETVFPESRQRQSARLDCWNSPTGFRVRTHTAHRYET
jgi:hypothetical protein